MVKSWRFIMKKMASLSDLIPHEGHEARYSGSEAGGRNMRISENRRHPTAQVRVGSRELELPKNNDKGLQSFGG